MKKTLLILCLAFAIPVFARQSSRQPDAAAEYLFKYVHGAWLKDPFRWMENRDNPELYKWIRGQNAYTQETLSGPIFEKLKDEFAVIYGGQAEGVVVGDDFHDDLFDKRRPNAQSTAELQSPDEKYDISSTSDSGGDFRIVKIKNRETGAWLDDTLVTKFSAFFWEEGSKSFLYNSDFDGRMGNVFPGIYRHRLGTLQNKDELIFEASSPDHFVSLEKGESKYFVEMGYGNFTDLYELNVADKTTRRIVSRLEDNFTLVDADDGHLYAVTYDHAPMGMIVNIDVVSGVIETVVQPTEVPIHAAARNERGWLVSYVKDAASQLTFVDHQTRAPRIVSLTHEGRAIPTADGENFRFAFSSYTASRSIWSYDPVTSETKLISQDPSPDVELEAGRVFYRAHNGQQTPIWVVKKKGLIPSADTPAYMYGYGGFAVNILPGLSRELIPWLKRGGIYAVVTLPGGLEYGEAWHKAGSLHNKLNVFRDFAEAGKSLVRAGITSHSKLAISGASNGGTLVASSLALYPQLFQAAVPHVGVLDMNIYHEHTGGKWWLPEYGDPRNLADFNYLMKYSAYHILKNQTYPHTLVMTSDLDDRVVPSHSYKFAAMLQSQKANRSPALSYTTHNGSHSPVTGAPEDVVRAMALKWTFLINATSGKTNGKDMQ